jgi:tRNA(adenine34) deaminase
LYAITFQYLRISAMSQILFSPSYFMKEAYKQAEMAFEADEVPVGAIVVCGDKIIARAHNLTQRLNDVTAHAEMQAYTAAAAYLGNKYLNECTLYVTLEPCTMCAGALFWSQIGALVYGASDPKRGFQSASGGLLLHPKTKIQGGLLDIQCSALIKAFFAKKR